MVPIKKKMKTWIIVGKSWCIFTQQSDQYQFQSFVFTKYQFWPIGEFHKPIINFYDNFPNVYGIEKDSLVAVIFWYKWNLMPKKKFK